MPRVINAAGMRTRRQAAEEPDEANQPTPAEEEEKVKEQEQEPEPLHCTRSKPLPPAASPATSRKPLGLPPLAAVAFLPRPAARAPRPRQKSPPAAAEPKQPPRPSSNGKRKRPLVPKFSEGPIRPTPPGTVDHPPAAAEEAESQPHPPADSTADVLTEPTQMAPSMPPPAVQPTLPAAGEEAVWAQPLAQSAAAPPPALLPEKPVEVAETKEDSMQLPDAPPVEATPQPEPAAAAAPLVPSVVSVVSESLRHEAKGEEVEETTAGQEEEERCMRLCIIAVSVADSGVCGCSVQSPCLPHLSLPPSLCWRPPSKPRHSASGSRPQRKETKHRKRTEWSAKKEAQTKKRTDRRSRRRVMSMPPVRHRHPHLLSRCRSTPTSR